MFNLSPSQMKKLAQQMGLKQVPGVEEVIIRTKDKDLVIKGAEVSSMNAMGRRVWQVVGDAVEVGREQGENGEKDELGAEESKPAEGLGGLRFSEEDVRLVVEKTGVGEEEARRALEESGGDIAQAIIEISK